MNSKSAFKTVTITFIVIALSACKTLNIQAPNEAYLAPKGNTISSEIPVNIALNVKKIEQSINQSLNGLLFEQDNINNQDLKIKVWKAKAFQIKTINDAIEYTVPIRIWSQFAWNFDRFGLSLSDKYEANGSLNLKYRTTMSFDKNWKISTNTTALGYEWIETPRISAMGVRIPVAGIANAALARSEKLISTEIDKYIASQLKIKPEVEKLWGELQKPLKVNDAYNLWLRVQPRDFFAAPLKSVGDFIVLQMGITAGIETFIGIKPDALDKKPLTQLSIKNKPADEFRMNIATDISFDALSNIAKNELKGQVFKDGKRQIEITDISIFGNNDKAIFVLDVIGSIKGRIYFSGKPVYNSVKKSIEIIQPEFDLQTKNALQKSASWLAGGIILQKIAPYLSYSVSSDLESLKTQSNTMLNNYQLYEGINIRASINDINVSGIEIVKGAFRMNSTLSGKVNVDIGDLKF